MYNEQIKRLFLNRYSDKDCETTFNGFSKYEELSGRDIAQMSRQEIIDILNKLCSTEIQSVRTKASHINQYREWCVKNAVFESCSEEVFPINVKESLDFVTPIYKTLFPSFDSILEELAFYDFGSGDEAGAAICLSWLGLKPTDIRMLKTESVDLNAGMIYLENRCNPVKISDERILNILRVYKTTFVATRFQHGGQYRIKMFDSGYFIHKMLPEKRPKNPGPVGSRQVYKSIVSAAENYEAKSGKKSKLSMPAIFKSGCLYRLLELERSGYDIYAYQNKDTLKRVYQSPGAQAADILFQYDCWKKAFGL